MEFCQANPRCHCMRCRVSGLMLPAVLITLGLLFLLQETGVKHFTQTWPLVLIVIGVVQIVKRSAPADEHVERGYEAYAMAQQQPPAPPAPIVTPAPAPNAGQLPPPSDSNGPNHGIGGGGEEAHNG